MNLPDGLEKAIIYDINYSYIIHNIKKMGFSGRCSASIHGDDFSLVFQDGICVLAEYQTHKGKTAYEKTLEQRDLRGDFRLYEYQPEELILADENNPEYVLGFGPLGTEGEDPVNLFEHALAELDKEDITRLKSKIQNEVFDFINDSEMKHLMNEEKSNG